MNYAPERPSGRSFFCTLTYESAYGNLSPMLKLSRNHKIYEVWCEWTAESVFIDHKPSKEELEEIRKKEWPGTDQWDRPYKLKVYKLNHFYTKA